MYFLWQIYSGPHSTTHGLPQVDSGTPISASNFQVHCRLERTSGQSCMLNLRVTLRCWPVWDTTSSVPALDPFMHCISCSIFPVHLTVTTCLSLMSLPFVSSTINTWLWDAMLPVECSMPLSIFLTMLKGTS